MRPDRHEIKPGDVVQIDPAHDEVFGGLFMTVTEASPWGVQGYIAVPGKGVSLAYYRCPYEAIEAVGRAAWAEYGAPDDEEHNDE